MRRPLAIGATLALVVGGVSAYFGFQSNTVYHPTVWVSATGNDTTCKVATSGAPCLTLTKAYTLAKPGSQILMKSGSYGNQTIAYSSTFGKPGLSPVVIKPAPGATVTGGFWKMGVYGSTRAPAYLTINGLGRTTISAFVASYDGTPAEKPVHDALLNTHVTSTTWAADALVELESVDFFLLQGNEIGPGAPNSDGIDVTTGNTGQPIPSHLSIIANNIHDLYESCAEVPSYITPSCTGTGFGDGGACSGGICNHIDGIQAYGCITCSILRNRFYLQGQDKQGIFMDTEVHSNTSQNLTIENNYVYTDGSDIAVGIKNTPSDHGLGYLRIDYNTIYSSDGLGLYFENTNNGANTEWEPGSTFRIVGNIIDGGGQTKCGSTWLYSDGTSIGSNFVWSNNMLGTAAACGSGDIGNTTPTYVQEPFPGVGAHCDNTAVTGCATVTGDPNLNLSGSQVAVDAGEATFCPAVDINGTPRPKGAACDLGAFEK